MKAPTLRTMLSRGRSIYGQSSEACRQEGRAWYPLARRQCERIATRSGRTLESVIYACAALSPLQPWETCLAMTADMSARSTFSNPGTFTKFAMKAWECLGNDLGALSGPKVTSFAMAISGDLEAIVVDRWIFRALGHHRDGATVGQYERMCEAIRRIARETEESPRSVQAILWVAVRDYHIEPKGSKRS